MHRVLVLAIVLGVSVAHAEQPRYAVAVNNPLVWPPWLGGPSFAISGYVAVAEHVALRANVATYPARRIGDYLSSDGSIDGRTTDLGLGVVYYFRRPYTGPFVELGAFRRSTPGYRDYEYEDKVTGTKIEWAAEALAGYSVSVGRSFWIAGAIGISVGHETGYQDDVDEVDHLPVVRTNIDHELTGGEWMFRIGAAF